MKASYGLSCSGRELFSEHGLEPLLLILIVQHHDGNHAERPLTAAADRDFSLQVLQEAVREAIQRALPAGILRTLHPAMRTGEIHHILLGIAVQSGPSGHSHTQSFNRLT